MSIMSWPDGEGRRGLGRSLRLGENGKLRRIGPCSRPAQPETERFFSRSNVIGDVNWGIIGQEDDRVTDRIGVPICGAVDLPATLLDINGKTSKLVRNRIPPSQVIISEGSRYGSTSGSTRVELNGNIGEGPLVGINQDATNNPDGRIGNVFIALRRDSGAISDGRIQAAGIVLDRNTE